MKVVGFAPVPLGVHTEPYSGNEPNVHEFAIGEDVYRHDAWGKQALRDLERVTRAYNAVTARFAEVIPW